MGKNFHYTSTIQSLKKFYRSKILKSRKNTKYMLYSRHAVAMATEFLPDVICFPEILILCYRAKTLGSHLKVDFCCTGRFYWGLLILSWVKVNLKYIEITLHDSEQIMDRLHYGQNLQNYWNSKIHYHSTKERPKFSKFANLDCKML